MDAPLQVFPPSANGTSGVTGVENPDGEPNHDHGDV